MTLTSIMREPQQGRSFLHVIQARLYGTYSADFLICILVYVHMWNSRARHATLGHKTLVKTYKCKWAAQRVCAFVRLSEIIWYLVPGRCKIQVFE